MQMIVAAERLGAERGLAAMSLREVQAAAGQRNKSAAQYHFGSRDGLVEAVVATRMGPINEARLEVLAELGPTPSVRDLVTALVDPLVDATIGRPPSHWARFLFQGWADPAVADVVRRSFSASSYRTVRRMLAERSAGLPAELCGQRIDRAVGLVVMALAAAESAATASADGDGAPSVQPDPGLTAAMLIDECCGLLEAPVSSATTAALDHAHTRIG